MSHTKSQRDLEYDYLSLAYQMEDLLQKKTAAYSVDADIKEAHLQMMKLAREIVTAADPRDREYDYLAAAYKVQDLLQQKSRAYHMAFEFEELQKKMEAVGAQLGWNQVSAPASGGSHNLTDRLSRLQSEIQELRATLS
jgi:hypothetical protein